MAVFASDKTLEMDASVMTDNHGVVIPAMPPTICQHRSQVLEGLIELRPQPRSCLSDTQSREQVQCQQHTHGNR